MSVWVVVASKYGSTREVAEGIADELRHATEVEVRDAGEVTDFEGADAVVLGSAIYGGHWLEPARRLVEEQADQLPARPTCAAIDMTGGYLTAVAVAATAGVVGALAVRSARRTLPHPPAKPRPGCGPRASRRR